MTKPDTPFPRHWLYYIVLKYACDRRVARVYVTSVFISSCASYRLT